MLQGLQLNGPDKWKCVEAVKPGEFLFRLYVLPKDTMVCAKVGNDPKLKEGCNTANLIFKVLGQGYWMAGPVE